MSLSGVSMTLKAKSGPKTRPASVLVGDEEDGATEEEYGNVGRNEVSTFDSNARLTEERDKEGQDLVIPVPKFRLRNKNELGNFMSSNGSATVENGRGKPLLMANLPLELLGNMAETEKFKLDMSLRVEDIAASSSAYSSVPIGQFGAAMLRGMGWKGPSADEVVVEEEKQRRQGLGMLGGGERSDHPNRNFTRGARLGLGATAKPPGEVGMKKRKAEIETEKWRTRARDEAGRRQQQLRQGDVIRICSGQHGGRRARVVATSGVPGLEKIRVMVEPDGNIVVIGSTEVKLESQEDLEEKPLVMAPLEGVAAEKQAWTNGATKKRSRPVVEQIESAGMLYDKDKDTGGEAAAACVPNKKAKLGLRLWQGQGLELEPKEPAWLDRAIRVRVVNRKPGGEAAYLKKGTVLDVYELGVASVRLDDGATLDGVKQKHLETVLPAVGAECQVLVGPYKGQRARLLEKNKQNGTVVIELQEEPMVVAMSMHFVAALACF